MSVIWPFVKNCPALALTWPKTFQQSPWLTTEIETRLPYGRVSYSGVVDHRSWLPVLSPLHSCVSSCHVWPTLASGGKPRRWMLEHISVNRPVWMGFNDLKHFVACCFAAKWRWNHVRENRKLECSERLLQLAEYCSMLQKLWKMLRNFTAQNWIPNITLAASLTAINSFSLSLISFKLHFTIN